MSADRYLKAILTIIAPIKVENVGYTPAQRPGE
jgi:hypothetical protein